MYELARLRQEVVKQNGPVTTKESRPPWLYQNGKTAKIIEYVNTHPGVTVYELAAHLEGDNPDRKAVTRTASALYSHGRSRAPKIKARLLDGKLRYYPVKATATAPVTPVEPVEPVAPAAAPEPAPVQTNDQAMTRIIETLAKDYAWEMGDKIPTLRGFIDWLKDK